MSVINQMLRDLDKRQAADQALLRTPALTVSQQRRWYWALLLLPALWLGVEIGQFGQKPAPEVATAKPQAEPEAAAVSPTSGVAPATAVAASPEPVRTAPDSNEVASAAEIKVPTKSDSTPPQREAVVPIAQQPHTAEQHEPEPVKTEIVAGSDAVAEAYALADSDAAFLAESETVAEPLAESQSAAPTVKPHMTISAADPQRVAQQQQRDLAALQWAHIQQLAGMQQWQALLDALTPALAQQYPQQVLALEAHAAQQTGQTERALQAYQRWSQLMPEDSRPWLGLGTMLDQRGQWPEAQQAYQQALQLGGLSPVSRQFIQQRLASATGQ
ncbi:tetratricopeptide repeat protein [Rheinheimera texasensis]|uniref:tetratricopeptide repeat protein n=1 Tax=Rheinheimera texasensis TaxID=306205 RepID=UPI0032B12A7A